ncbi:MAG: hypothetical protein AAB439_02945 [Patescibacteria group bacterium]
MKQLLVSALVLVFPLMSSAATVSNDIGVSTDVGVSAKPVQISVGATTTVEVGASGSTNVETPSGVVVEVQRDSGHAEVTIEHAISGDPDFDLYVQTIQKQRAEVANVHVDEAGAVDVSYRHHGRFLGVLPVVFTSRTEVTTDSEGRSHVSVRLPWWSGLVDTASKVRSEIQSHISAQPTISASAEAQVSARSRIELMNALINAVSDADVSVQAELSQ